MDADDAAPLPPTPLPASSPAPGAVEAASRLMDAFLEETGVTGRSAPRRYLWTDAFAVCTLVELHRLGATPGISGAGDYRSAALALVDQVHHTLGRHRHDDPRTGWLSGLEGAEAEEHPTAGGLRIGKPLPERGLREPMDRDEEWERDGQYFHYLTRWMHALLRVATAEDEARFLRWAVELGRVAYGRFRQERGRAMGPHLAWKMSIGLDRALVDTAGQHDPLDGYLTFRSLDASPLVRDLAPLLARETAGTASMAGIGHGRGWATDDPLGLGGLLVDAVRAFQLARRGTEGMDDLVVTLLDSAVVGLRAFHRGGTLARPPARRLPFRELGLAIGLHGIEWIRRSVAGDGPTSARPALADRITALAGVVPLATRIEETWLDPGHRTVRSWWEHGDINAVMLATSLVPGGYLSI